MALTEGLAALNSLRTLYEIARDVRNSADPEKLRAAAAQMFDLALAAREQTALLQEERNAAMIELTALKAEIESTDRFDKDAEKYARERNTGSTVYRETGSSGRDGESPYYCPNCFAHKRLSIMNPAPGENTGMGVCVYLCRVCELAMPLGVLYSPAPPKLSG